MRQFIADIHNREEGATAAEYVFLLIFVAIVVSVAMATLGDNISTLFTNTGAEISSEPVGEVGGD